MHPGPQETLRHRWVWMDRDPWILTLAQARQGRGCSWSPWPSSLTPGGNPRTGAFLRDRISESSPQTVLRRLGQEGGRMKGALSGPSQLGSPPSASPQLFPVYQGPGSGVGEDSHSLLTTSCLPMRLRLTVGGEGASSPGARAHPRASLRGAPAPRVLSCALELLGFWPPGRGYWGGLLLRNAAPGGLV